jgi:DNA-binding NarL/FixJ family response regulator
MTSAITCHCRKLALVAQEPNATGQLEAALSILRSASVEAQGCESTVARDLSAAHALGSLALERLRRAESHPAPEPCERRAAIAAERLTPGEWRVATLAAAGLTNRQIANALYVTVKAVQWHLSNIYRKLDIRSRDQIRGFVPAGEAAESA